MVEVSGAATAVAAVAIIVGLLFTAQCVIIMKRWNSRRAQVTHAGCCVRIGIFGIDICRQFRVFVMVSLTDGLVC